MKNKGFTLVEILATVIVFTIVMLIVVPITLNIIDKSKKRSFIASAIVISDDIKNGIIKDVIETNIDTNSMKNTVTIFLNDEMRNRLQIGSNYEGYIVVTKNGNTFENKLFISDTKAKLSICDETNETVSVSNVYNVSSCKIVLSGVQIKPVDVDEIKTEILDNTSMKLLAHFNDKDVPDADKKVSWEAITDSTLNVAISDVESLKPTFTFTGYGEATIKLISTISNKEDRVKITVYPHASSLKIVKIDGSAIDDKVFQIGTIGNLVAVFDPDIANMHYVQWSVTSGEENVVIEQVGDRQVTVEAINSGIVTLKAYSPLTEISKEVTFRIKEDLPPEFSLCKVENANVTNGSVNILINVFDMGDAGYMHTIKPDSTITTLSTFIYPVTTNGTYTFTSLDFDNNSNSCQVVVNNIDSTAPTASITSSNNNYTKDSITLTITASDANFSHIILPDNSTSLTKVSTYVVSNNGTYSFNVYDKAGNSTTKSFTVSNIDKLNPNITLTQNTSSYVNTSVIITTASSDGESGFDKVLLPDGTYSTSSNATYTVTTNGTYSFTTYDKVGNSITKTITVSNIDKTIPTFTKCEVTSNNYTNATITISAIDSGGSGYKHTVKPDSTISTLSTFTYVVNSNTSYTFKALDNAGNQATCTVTVTEIDVTPPTATLVSSNSNYTNQNITLTITASDTNFSHIIMPDNSTSLNKVSTYLVSANGSYSFKVYDKAGNNVTKSITVSNIDKVNPTLTLTQSPTSYTNGNVTITAASTDALSGFYRVLLPNSTYSTSASATYAVSSNGTYSFTTYDKAGNSFAKSITVSNIDKTAPTFSTCAVTSTTSTNATITITVADTGGSGFYRTLRPNGTYSTSSSFTYAVTASGQYSFTAYDNAGNSKACTVNATINSVNPPVLASGMTPIKWNGFTMVTTTTSDPDWYDYGTSTKKWANAKTADGSMWVWIPRYAYQITSGYHSSTAGNIAIKFLNGTGNTAFDGTAAAAVNQGNNPGSNTKYVTHPAFKFGTTEVTGIWVMKFVMSYNNGLKSVPSATIYSSQTPSQMFNLSRSIETNSTYGWGTSGSGIDTHMVKDVERGAVSYLAWSTYGKNSEPWENNSMIGDVFSTVNYISGCTGNSETSAKYAGCQNAYNTSYGQNASTTGNVYGVYDFRTGRFMEATAGYLKDGGNYLTSVASSMISANDKYKDVYIGSSSNSQTNYNSNSGYYGNALYETSSSGSSGVSWGNQHATFVHAPYGPLFGRGYGLFGFLEHDWNTSPSIAWRTTLIVQSGL